MHYVFIDIFLGWSTLRKRYATFSHDETTFKKNGGEQSIYIFKDNKKIEFLPEDIRKYQEFMLSYFDVQLELKAKDPTFAKDFDPQTDPNYIDIDFGN